MEAAFENVLLNVKKNDRIVIYGSFYTVSEFLKFTEISNKKVFNE